jgi:phosphoenolpyruvate carboxykinase (GTP)
VLKWIAERVASPDLDGAVSTPVGLLPAPGALDLSGLDISQDDLDLLLTVDVQAWKREAEQMPEFFRGFGGHLPARLWELHEELTARLA